MAGKAVAELAALEYFSAIGRISGSSRYRYGNRTVLELYVAGSDGFSGSLAGKTQHRGSRNRSNRKSHLPITSSKSNRALYPGSAFIR